MSEVYEVSKRMNFFDVAKSINHAKYIPDIADTTKYDVNPYMLGVLYSNTPDSVLIANEANKFTIDSPKMYYDFYYHLLPYNPKRYGTWHKSSKDTHDELIKKIMQVYGYSREKAIHVLGVIANNPEAIAYIEEATAIGGSATKRKKGV